MTREELEKEAEMFVSEKADKGNFDVEKFGKAYFSESSMKQALVKFAEPREKRIAELEEIVQGYDRNRDRLISMGFPTFQSCKEYAEKIKDLEQQISTLLSCKDCPENKGGYICSKEYNDRCLAQKIEYIKELKEENAELKEKIRLQNEQEAKDIRARFAY